MYNGQEPTHALNNSNMTGQGPFSLAFYGMKRFCSNTLVGNGGNKDPEIWYTKEIVGAGVWLGVRGF